MSGEALAMRVQLARLQQRFNIAPAPVLIPLRQDTIDGPVILEGLASTGDVDLTRMKFRGYAFINHCTYLSGYPKPPLLWKHDAAQVAGEIQTLRYDDRGNLRISASVTHEQAKRAGAFSVGAKVLAYELKDADSPDFYALVTSAEIAEISCTDLPANPHALVQHRYKAPPFEACQQALHEGNALLIRSVDLMLQQVELIRQLSDQPAPPATKPRQSVRTERPPQPSRRPTQFSQLVTAMQENAHV
jgi:hypothetical protein